MSNKLKAIIEGLLFIHGEDGVSLSDLQNVLDTFRPVEIQEAILALQQAYLSNDDSALSIQSFGKHKYRLQTKPELYEYFAKLEHVQAQSRLSAASIEVLSIITYKGPIAKTQIDSLRNVDSAYQIYKLKDRKLIKAVSKSKTGANLYGITDNFFKLFNIQGGMEALPQVEFAQHIQTALDEHLALEPLESNENHSEELFDEPMMDEGLL